jgi:DNA mismatch endonuclease, patch repair protein
MGDVLSRAQRSYCMSKIRGKDTSPELRLRKALWNAGVRYRIKSAVIGRPDIVIAKARLAVFVDGCFWHRCPRHFVMPNTRPLFWKTKIMRNQARDKFVNATLKRLGWEVVRLWEHEIDTNLQAVCARITRLSTKRLTGNHIRS